MNNTSVHPNEAKNKPQAQTRPPDMLRAALWYARKGWYVMPLHTPIFDDAGTCTGCTCEAYKRSDKYRAELENRGQAHRFNPAYKCTTPGKHPRHSAWEDRATTVPEQIRRWWEAWPQANIGAAVGKSGLVTLDHDTYKDEYAGGDLPAQDVETVTSLTGGGGTHLWYTMPAGREWTNASGTLPAGVDIRAHGGIVVLPPSLHPSGRRYQFEWGYSLGDMTPAPAPGWLADILDAAQAEHARTHRTIELGPATTERPDLGNWHLAQTTRAAIETPPARGGRSEHDARVCVALLYAGATPADVAAVFEHYPVGTAGKYAEAGRPYLKRTIAAAVGYVEDNPPPKPLDGAQLAGVLEWTLSGEGRDALGALGYKRMEGPLRTLSGVLALLKEYRSPRIVAGVRRIGEAGGQGHTAAAANLRILGAAGWLEVHPDENGAWTVGLGQMLQSRTVVTTRMLDLSDFATFEHLCDDAFASYPRVYAAKRRKCAPEDLLRGLGFNAGAVWGALAEGAEGTQAIADAAALSPATVRAALRKMNEAGLVDVWATGEGNRKGYALAQDAGDLLDVVRPRMASYGRLALIMRRNALAQAAYAHRSAQALADPRAQARAQARQRDKDELAQVWGATLEAAGIDLLAKVRKGNTRARRRGLRYDRRELAATWYSMGDTPAERSAHMEAAGWDDVEVKIAAQAARRLPDPGYMDLLIGDGCAADMPTFHFNGQQMTMAGAALAAD